MKKHMLFFVLFAFVGAVSGQTLNTLNVRDNELPIDEIKYRPGSVVRR